MSHVTHLTTQEFKAHGDHHSSHERQNAFNRITLDRRDERPIALPQLEPPGGGGTGNGNGEEQEKDLVSRVQSLETRIAKLEDRLGKCKFEFFMKLRQLLPLAHVGAFVRFWHVMIFESRCTSKNLCLSFHMQCFN